MSTKNDKAPVSSGPRAAPAPGPGDLELMLHADGELEGDAIATVDEWLARDRAARQKALALGLTSAIVREQALAAAEQADGIADLVMKAIAADAEREAKDTAAAPEREVADPPRKAAAVAPIGRKPANDNARSFRVIAALAVAAAAALLLWGRGSTDHAGTQPTAALTLPAPHDTAIQVEPPLPEREAARGVEVSAVDFGGHTGAVFYVPTGSAASDTTAVVWLSDDSSGGNE